MKKGSKKQLLFDVLTGLNAATQGGVQGYMSGKKYAADMRTQQLKDLLSRKKHELSRKKHEADLQTQQLKDRLIEAKIEALIGKQEEEQSKNEKIEDRNESVYNHVPEKRTIPFPGGGEISIPFTEKEDPEYLLNLKAMAVEELKGQGVPTNEKNISLKIKEIKKRSVKKKETKNEVSKVSTSTISQKEVEKQKNPNQHHPPIGFDEDFDGKEIAKNTLGGVGAGIGEYLKKRIKFAGTQAGLDAVEMQSPAVKAHFTKKAKSKEYRRKIEQQEAKKNPELAAHLEQIENPEEWVEALTSHGKENFTKHLDKEVFDPIGKKYVKKIDLDPDSKSYKAGSFVSEMGANIAEPGLPLKAPKFLGKGAKFSKQLTERLKTVPDNAVKGAIEGAVYNTIDNPELDPKDLAISSGLGAILKSAFGLKIPKKAKQKDVYKELQKGSNLNLNKKEDLQTLKDREQIMGEEALLSDLLGAENLIEHLKQDSSKYNTNRMGRTKNNIHQHTMNTDAPMKEYGKDANPLYKEIEEVRAKYHEAASQKYDFSKENGLGEEGRLKREDLKAWIREMKDVAPDYQGKLKNMRGKSSYKDIEKQLSEIEFLESRGMGNTPEVQKMINENLPTVSDFIKFESQLNKSIANPGNNFEPLSQLQEALNRIAQKDPSGSLSKAKKAWKSDVVPFTEGNIPQATASGRFDHTPETGQPTVGQTFKKTDNVELTRSNALVFTKLSGKQKREVVERMWGDFKRSHSSDKPKETMVYEFWKSLPGYIKSSNDTELKPLLRNLEKAFNLNTTKTSLQGTIKADKGGQQEGKEVVNILKGNIFSAMNFWAKYQRKKDFNFLHKTLNQKNMKYYLNPSLLDEIKTQRSPARKSIQMLRTKQKEEEQ